MLIFSLIPITLLTIFDEKWKTSSKGESYTSNRKQIEACIEVLFIINEQDITCNEQTSTKVITQSRCDRPKSIIVWSFEKCYPHDRVINAVQPARNLKDPVSHNYLI